MPFQSTKSTLGTTKARVFPVAVLIIRLKHLVIACGNRGNKQTRMFLFFPRERTVYLQRGIYSINSSVILIMENISVLH